MKKNPAMKNQINQKTFVPMIAVLVCAVLLIVSTFLPYFTAVDEYKEMLELAEQKPTLSLLDFFKVLLEDSSAATTVVGILAGLSIFAALFAILRLPAGTMAFDILATAATVLLHLAFASDDILAYYAFGIGHALMFVACVGLLVGTVWMMVAKSQAKKTFATANTEM